jgi:hypothetical protein
VDVDMKISLITLYKTDEPFGGALFNTRVKISTIIVEDY